MSGTINSIFSLLQTALNIVMANPLLTLLIGLSIAALIFGLLSRVFVRR